MRLWRLVVLALPLIALLALACGDDDDYDDVDPSKDSATEVETASPSGTDELTDEMIEAASEFLAEPSDDRESYEVTDPALCEDITEEIDAGESELQDFVGENLVCLTNAEIEGSEVRVGFGPYASEVIGAVVLESTNGGYEGTGIEP